MKKNILKNKIEDINEKKLKLKEDNKEFYKIMLSEMGAAFLITFLLLILNSLYIGKKNFAYWITLSFISTDKNQENVIKFCMIGFYVWFVVFITIVCFERWSCNANPTVSLYLYLIKKNNLKTLLYKILFQLIGATIAGSFQMIIVNLQHTKETDFTGFYNNNIFGFGEIKSLTHFFTANVTVFFIESIAAFGLCWSLCSKSINNKVKLFSVLGYLFIAATFAAPTGVLSFNSARAYGAAIFHDLELILVWNQKLTIWNSELIFLPLFFLAPAFGTYLYYCFQSNFDNKILPIWLKIIGKNNK